MAVFRIEKTRDYNGDVQSPPAQRGSVPEIQRAALHDAVLAGGLELHHQRLGQNLQRRHGQYRFCPEGAGTGPGYIVRNRLRDSKGKIVDVEYVIYETPHPPDTGQPCEDEPDTACPDTGNPDMDNPCLENRPQLNKEKRNPEEQNTDSPSTEGSNPIQSSPQTPAGGKRTGRDWDARARELSGTDFEEYRV